MPKGFLIPKEKWDELEKTALAILKDQASAYYAPTKRMLGEEEKNRQIMQYLENTNLPAREIAKRLNVPVSRVETAAQLLYKASGKSRQGRVESALYRDPKKFTGVFSEKEALEAIFENWGKIRQKLDSLARRKPWILHNGRTMAFLEDWLQEELKWKLLVFPKKHNLNIRDREAVARVVNATLGRFVLKEILRKCARQDRKTPKVFYESTFKEASRGPYLSSFPAPGKKPSSSRAFSRAPVLPGLSREQRILLLARSAGMNLVLTAKILGCSKSNISVMLEPARRRFGVKRLEHMAPRTRRPWHFKR